VDGGDIEGLVYRIVAEDPTPRVIALSESPAVAYAAFYAAAREAPERAIVLCKGRQVLSRWLRSQPPLAIEEGGATAQRGR
jgi:hypothetical protein